MNLLAGAILAAERISFPDAVTLGLVDALVMLGARRLARRTNEEEARFVAEMASQIAGAQNNRVQGCRGIGEREELPPEFFDLILGPQRKYSCCRYPDPTTSLAEAEILALDETIAHAAIEDGQRILELGAGWGSLGLRLAEQFTDATIVCVPNSQAQRGYVQARARERSLPNLTAVAADANAFAAGQRFDRVLSVETFGQIADWRAPLAQAYDWLEPDGRLFVHVFSHRSRSYRLGGKDPIGGLASHFFAGGLMPAQNLPHRFAELFSVEAEWRWSGADYQRTALDWLADFDSNRARLDEILSEVYGAQAALWRRRWRLFFLATAGLFGYAGGSEWGVGHYRMAPVPAR